MKNRLNDNPAEKINPEVYFTVTGTGYYFGADFFTPDMKVFLEKEPDNDHDKEAIRVTVPGLGLVGYVANSPHTVLGESFSAGRLYDKIGDTACADVVFNTAKGILCRVEVDSLRRECIPG